MSKSEGRLNVLVLGATSVIAQATIRTYALKHACLYLVARNEDKLNVVAADARIRGAGEIHTQALDLDDTGAHEGLLADVARSLPDLDIVLIAHGVLGEQAEGERAFAAAEKVFQTNFLSAASLLTLIANYFEQRNRGGTIAAISSVAGDRGRKSNYIYGTSKAALTIFLQGLRARLSGQGVHVLTVKPGFVATPMTAHLKQGPLFARPEKIARGIVSAIERKREVVYLPWFWRPIMFMIRAVPEKVFKELNV
jgi:decaprenylphospho-beta-D-erythro-pentofuranosid-2-ulose 2-reductase